MPARLSEKLVVVIFVAVVLASSAIAEFRDDAEQRWNFRVYLDDSEIGTHSFTLRDDGNVRRLQSEAAFNVKFLFFTAYRYRHSNSEEWLGGCLAGIEARTVTNGKTIEVSGEMRNGNFVVHTSDDTRTLSSCVMTFAYWNPAFLQQGSLLNPQTGQYLDVDVESLPPETLKVRGEPVEARHFRVVARDIELQLWYSQNDEWLALESVARGGRLIRYELI